MSTATTELPEGVVLRSLAGGDVAYVLSTWLRELRAADRSPLTDELFFGAHRPLVEGWLTNPSTNTAALVAADRPTEILGWIAWVPSEETILWVHVRKGLRGRGLAGHLLRSTGLQSPTKSAWVTRDGRERLRLLPRGRELRHWKPGSTENK